MGRDRIAMESGIDLQGQFIRALESLGLSHDLAKLLWLPLPMLMMLIVATVGVLVAVWLERKISAAVQQRIGPEYIGPLGILAPLADGLKLIFKEDVLPANTDRWLFTLGRSGGRDSCLFVLYYCPLWPKPTDLQLGDGGLSLDCPLQYCAHWPADVGLCLQQQILPTGGTAGSGTIH